MLILHSLVPHHHHDELSDEEHEIEHDSAETLLDYLELLFHVDAGDGHLEHFQSGEGFNLDFNFTIDGPSVFIENAINLGSFDPVADNTPIPICYYKKVPIPPNILFKPLRGPPSIS